MTRAALSCWLFPALLYCGCTANGSLGTLKDADGGMRSMDAAGGGAASPEPTSTPLPASTPPPTSTPLPTSTPTESPRDAAVNTPPMCVQPVALHSSLALQFVVDDSADMAPWWPTLLAAFREFVDDPESAGVSVGLSFVREQCFDGAYLAPVVAISALPSNSTPITDAFKASEAALRYRAKATLAALGGTLGYARGWAQEHPGTETRVVLMTMDLTSDCNSDEEKMIQAAREGFEHDVPIRTHVVAFGAQGSKLNPIAEAGGTEAAWIVNFVTPPEEILRSLNVIRDSALPSGEAACSVLLPSGQPIDAARAQLRMLLGGSEQVIAGVQNRAACAGASDGFYYDELAKSLVGCDQSCDKLRSAERLDLLSECPAEP